MSSTRATSTGEASSVLVGRTLDADVLMLNDADDDENLVGVNALRAMVKRCRYMEYSLHFFFSSPLLSALSLSFSIGSESSYLIADIILRSCSLQRLLLYLLKARLRAT